MPVKQNRISGCSGLLLLFACGFVAAADALPEKIGWHKAVCDDAGELLPWTSGGGNSLIKECR